MWIDYPQQPLFFSKRRTRRKGMENIEKIIWCHIFSRRDLWFKKKKTDSLCTMKNQILHKYPFYSSLKKILVFEIIILCKQLAFFFFFCLIFFSKLKKTAKKTHQYLRDNTIWIGLFTTLIKIFWLKFSGGGKRSPFMWKDALVYQTFVCV